MPVFDFDSGQILGARERQEDFFGFGSISNWALNFDPLLGVLADGMGGLADGDRAAELVVDSFLEYMEGSDVGELARRLESVAEVANREVVKMFDGPALGGSTLVGFYIFEESLYWTSVGDSLLLIYREGTLTRLNADHSMRVQLEGEVLAGRMTRGEVLSHPGRNALFSYLGGEVIESIDNNTEGYPLKPNDIVIAASDGLLSLTGSGALEAYLAENAHKEASAICTSILKKVEALKEDHQDNATLMLVKI